MFALLGELKDDPGRPHAVRYVTSTAAALLPKHIEAIARWFPRAKVYSMYGLTECKRVSWLPPPTSRASPARVGMPIPGTEFWVVDAEGNRRSAPEEGELVVRGSHIMQGLWRKPEVTARYLRPGPLPTRCSSTRATTAASTTRGTSTSSRAWTRSSRPAARRWPPRGRGRARAHRGRARVRRGRRRGRHPRRGGEGLRGAGRRVPGAVHREGHHACALGRCWRRTWCRSTWSLDALPKTEMGKIVKKGLESA
jgi:acyl-CoA synthetase (AMP-forming)/AMP-acid ligase II